MVITSKHFSFKKCKFLKPNPQQGNRLRGFATEPSRILKYFTLNQPILVETGMGSFSVGVTEVCAVNTENLHCAIGCYSVSMSFLV